MAATLAARCGDNHDVGVDELTVKEERGEEKKGGRRGVLRSRRVTFYLRWYQGGAGQGIDAQLCRVRLLAMRWTKEMIGGARASVREREKGGARCGAAGPGAGGPAHTEERKGRGEGEE